MGWEEMFLRILKILTKWEMDRAKYEISKTQNIWNEFYREMMVHFK